MGTSFAPSYSNLFRGQFESHFIQNQNPLSNNIKLYKRYIDNLFFIWDGSETEFEHLTTYLNKNDYGIILSGKISSNSIEYLDILLTTHENKTISGTHFKKVDTNNLLAIF